MNTKPFWTSKELWLVGIGVANYLLNSFGYPSFEPTPEIYTALLVLIAAVRGWLTQSGIRWSLS